MTAAPSRRHLTELYRKVDAVFARTRARYRKSMACDSGCNGCCSRALEVSAAEAPLVRDAFAALPEATRGALAARAAAAGMPLRAANPSGARQLPVLEVCGSNFVGQDLEALEAAAVLDMRTMGAVLESISDTHAAETGAPRGEKVRLAAAFTG